MAAAYSNYHFEHAGENSIPIAVQSTPKFLINYDMSLTISLSNCLQTS